MVITMSTSNGLSDVYFNGVSQGQITLGVMTEFAAIALGPSRYTYDCANAYSYESFNYVAAHLAVYAYQLTAERIVAHYITGADGRVRGDRSGTVRADPHLGWAGFETGRVLVAGSPPGSRRSPRSAPPTPCPARRPLTGSTRSRRRKAAGPTRRPTDPMCTRRGGRVTTSPPSPTSVTTPSAVRLSSTRPRSRKVLSAPGCPRMGHSPSPQAQAYGGAYSALLTPTGGNSAAWAADNPVPVTAGSLYSAGAWVYSPTGWVSVQIGVDWYADGTYVSTSAATVSVPPGAWVYISSGAVTAPTGPDAHSGALHVGEADSPAAGNLLYIGLVDAARRVPGDPVPAGAPSTTTTTATCTTRRSGHPAIRAEPADYRGRAEHILAPPSISAGPRSPTRLRRSPRMT